MGRGYGVPQSLVDQEMRRSVVALQASDVQGGAPVAKTSLVHLIIIIIIIICWNGLLRLGCLRC